MASFEEQILRYQEAPDPVKYANSIRRLGRVARLLWDIDVIGEERIPRKGAGILAFSPRSHTEIFLQGIIVPRALRAMMKQEVQSYPIIGDYLAARGIFFVNREDPDPETIAETYSYLEQELLLDMNPEGTSKNRGPKLGELHPGVAVLAVKAARAGIDCPIVPVGMASEHLWRLPHGRVPVVVGYPFYPNIEGRKPGQAIRETHQRLEKNLQYVFDLAVAVS